MPTKRRRSHCFCLFTVLALACDTSSSVATRRLVRPPPSPSISVKLPVGTYNLRGSPIQGRTRHMVTNIDIDAAQLSVKVGSITVTGTMGMHVEATDELEILAVRGGWIESGRLTHVLDKTTSTSQMNLPDGTVEQKNEEEFGELHGRTELISLIDGAWTRKLVGAAPSAEVAVDLENAPIDDAAYPAAIKVGESWTLTGPDLRHWLGSSFTATRGQIKSTLVAVEVLPAETIAIIESVGELGGKISDEGERDMDFVMRIQGTERRSLERALELESSAHGLIEFSQAYVEDGEPVSLSVTGPINIRIKGALH